MDPKTLTVSVKLFLKCETAIILPSIIEIVNLTLSAVKKKTIDRQARNSSSVSTSSISALDLLMKEYEEEELPTERKAILAQISQKGLDIKNRK